MQVRAFNLVPGAGFREEGNLFGRVVVWIDRDSDHETVYGRDHWGKPFAFDYCHEVELVGLDANLGTEGEEATRDLGTAWGDAQPTFVPDSTSTEDTARPEHERDAVMDAAVEALVTLGFTLQDDEENLHVGHLHRVLIEHVPLAEIETIIHPPAHG